MATLAFIQTDIFGIIILLYFWLNQRRTGSLSVDDRVFNDILITVIVIQLADMGQWGLEGVIFPGSYVLQTICYTIGFSLAPLVPCLWAIYCDLRTHLDERGLRRRLPLYLLPIVLHALLMIANLFTPLVYWIDENHIYHRDLFFVVYMILIYVYSAVAVWFVFQKTRESISALERTELHYMALFIVPPLIGGLLQGIFFGISVVWLCVVLSLIMVYTNVLSRQISTDPLTGLNNYRKLKRYLDLKISAAETENRMFLMMLDADRFKMINDTYGHSAGDRALVSISEILKKVCQNRCYILARIGGDEFVICGYDQEGYGPQQIASQLEKAMGEYNATTREAYRLSLSFGWAYLNVQTMKTADALMNAADQAMYRAKAQKKSSFASKGGGQETNIIGNTKTSLHSKATGKVRPVGFTKKLSKAFLPMTRK